MLRNSSTSRAVKAVKVRKPVILINSGIMPSARLLRDAIEQVSGVHYWIVTEPDGRDVFLRYGNSTPVSGKDIHPEQQQIIHDMSNKLRFSGILHGAGIATPIFSSDISRVTQEQFPIMVRSTLTSFGGRGITVVRNSAELTAAWRPGYHWTRFLNFTDEYRVHICNGQLLRTFIKIREEGAAQVEFPVRNSDNGWHFSLQNKPRHRVSIEALVKNLMERLPAYRKGFFALDLGWEASTKTMYIIEGNSAPGLNENTADAYARAILNVESAPQPAAQPAVVQAAQPPEVNNAVVRTAVNDAGVRPAPAADTAGAERQHTVVRNKWEW